VPFPRHVTYSNVPIGIPRHFVGRDEALEAIAKALASSDGRAAATALHGVRGVGKTTLAAAYAERHRGDYRATWWIRAQTAGDMRADLVALGIQLGWVTADQKEQEAIEIVMERLRYDGGGILLIYDDAPNAAALRGYLPPGVAAHVLITSNARAWRHMADPILVEVWPKEIGADYLIARTGRTAERNAAESLSDALGGLPLAHEQAAAFCEDKEIGFSEYHQRFFAQADFERSFPDVPVQGPGPHFVLSDDGIVTFAPPDAIDRKGNNIALLRSLHPTLRDLARALCDALGRGSMPHANLHERARSYLELVDQDLESVPFARLYVEGVRLQNAAAAASTKIIEKDYHRSISQ
jgi:hypothetical protein